MNSFNEQEPWDGVSGCRGIILYILTMKTGYILFYQEISTGLIHHYGGMVNFARAAESEQCFSKWEGD